MKLPHHVAGVSLALALAACSGAQTGVTPNTLPAAGAPQNSSFAGAAMSSVSKVQHLTGAHKATTALILVANEGGGAGGTISEFSESANGNVAPTSVITNHANGPYGIAFSSKEGIGISNGPIDSGGQFGAETFSLTGDFLTGITCFPKPSNTHGVAFDSTGQLFLNAFLPEGGRAIDVFKSGANNCAKPKRTISDEGGLAIDSTTFSTSRIARRQRSTSSRRDRPPWRPRSAEATPAW